MEYFTLLLDHIAWIKHQFLSGIRDSRKTGSLWVMVRGVGGVRKSIHQNWLAKGLGLGLLCWGFKGVQEEIPSEEASTLQIESVTFPPEQCSSLQPHPWNLKINIFHPCKLCIIWNWFIVLKKLISHKYLFWSNSKQIFVWNQMF